MSDTVWARVQSHFAAALDREGAARAAFLAALAREEPACAPLVAALVAAHERDPDFLEPAPTGGDERAVGPYRLARELGEGGMGVVYLASRDDGGFHRPVAIKVAHRGLAGGALAHRLAQERDILARLSHPNIAHLYDGGLTDDGRPYLVMEHVAGTPITEHCARRALPRAERLRLVQVVCRAVDHAHRHLVVHRDLKPTNILVTDEGDVKLLDFGVAKVLEPEATAGDGTPTLVALTPAYAAPEQLGHGRVTTATDVWGLGVVAYELVAGRRPYATDGLSMAAVERLVGRVDPPPPTVVAGGRRPCDLDHVLLRALAREPEARYATPRDFADDLQRALDGRPVLARAPTLGYRARRFVRRHRGRVAAAAGAVLALAVGAALALDQARLATAAARRAEAARREAEAATVRARRINRFLQGVLATANPAWYVSSVEKGPDVTVLRALELAAARMARELADDPETRADIHATLGDTYRVLGRPREMADHFDSTLALRARLFAPPHPRLADAMFAARVAATARGRWDRADSLARAALRMQWARDEGNNLPYLLADVAGLDARAGRHRAALARLDTAVAVAAARHDPTHYLRISLDQQRALSLLALDRVDEARAVVATLAARSAASGRRDDDPLRLRALLAARDGDFAAADALFAESQALAPVVWRPTWELLRVRALLLPSGRHAAARGALAAVRRTVGSRWPAEAGVAPLLVAADALAARAWVDAGRPDRAAAAARAALALADTARGHARGDPFWEARTEAQRALAAVHVAAGAWDAAARRLGEARRAVAARELAPALLDSLDGALAALRARDPGRAVAQLVGTASPSSSARSHARANVQSRFTVASDTASSSATAGSESPPK